MQYSIVEDLYERLRRIWNRNINIFICIINGTQHQQLFCAYLVQFPIHYHYFMKIFKYNIVIWEFIETISLDIENSCSNIKYDCVTTLLITVFARYVNLFYTVSSIAVLHSVFVWFLKFGSCSLCNREFHFSLLILNYFCFLCALI